MKDKEIVFLVGSLIKPMSGKFRTVFDVKVQHRSHQTPRERAEQTIFGLNSIFCKYPNAKVILLEASLDITDNDISKACHSGGQFNYLQEKNIEIIKMTDVNRDICKKINTHENKSYCEALLFDTFLTNFPDKINDYDYVVKLSGRYSLTDNCNIDSLKGTGNIYFKEYKFWDHLDKTKIWAPDQIRLPNQETWEMYWTPCFLFVFGKERIPELKEFFKFIMSVTDEGNVSTEDAIEYWVKSNNKESIKLDWRALAYTGTDGTFWHF
tara:strand:+ start:205 stop:1005 length:801 start_codon:yes stop_codon:yes gene_type:complete